MTHFTNIAVFCGANPGRRPEYEAVAIALGAELGRRGLGLVYGGGSVGMMGALARSARDHGSQVIGVIPGPLMTRELMGDKVGDLIVVETMHERKAQMVALADAFVALPGGFGTLDELFEVITWGQLGIHAKPVGLLNVAGFFDPLLVWIDHAVDEGFVRPHHRDLVVVEAEIAALFDRLHAYQSPPSLVKWLNLDEA